MNCCGQTSEGVKIGINNILSQLKKVDRKLNVFLESKNLWH